MTTQEIGRLGSHPEAAGEQVEQTEPRVTRKASAGPAVDRAAFRRYAVALATHNRWEPWAEFADLAWRHLSPRRPPHGAEKCARCQLHKAWVTAEAARFHDHQVGYAAELQSASAAAMATYGRIAPATAIAVARQAEQAAATRVPDAPTPAAVDTATRHVGREHDTYDEDGRQRVSDSLGAWQLSRAAVLEELDMLGLVGTVVRTDQDVPLGEHEADLAGLVRLHTTDGPPEPSLPAWAWRGQGVYARHALQMMAQHRLMPAAGLPTGLRAFCGQYTNNPHHPSWTDHIIAWQDDDGLPVLTVEPYRDDPAQLADEVRTYVDREGLPLMVNGPHPGIWNEGTVLVILHYDEAPVLPAERRVYDGLVARMVAA